MDACVACRAPRRGERHASRPDDDQSREAFQDAIGRASRFGNPELYPEHLLAAMLDQEGGVAAPLLQKAGADVAELRSALARRVGFPGLPAARNRACRGERSK